MIDLARNKANRARVLKLIYDAAEGSRINWVSGQWLLDASGLPDEELDDICEYLKSEYMIEARQTLWGHATPFHMRLDHNGVKGMESAADSPDEAEDELPVDLARVAEVRLFESSGEAIDLPEDEMKQLAAEMRTVKVQVAAPRPNHKTIRQHLETARQILIGAAAIALVGAITFVLHHL